MRLRETFLKYLGEVSEDRHGARAKRTKANRFKRIAGQVQGIANMILDDRYCIDILHQIQAVKSALARAESEVLRDHAACCVAEAIKSGNSVEQKIKLDEIIALFDKAKR